MVKKYLVVTLAVMIITGLIGTASSTAAAAAPAGYADFTYLVEQHPDTAKANEILRAEQAAAKQEFAAKSASLNDQEKLELDRQLGLKVEQKRLELLKPIAEKVAAAVKEVAKAKGLSLVVNKQQVIYGEVDITQEVLAKISGK